MPEKHFSLTSGRPAFDYRRYVDKHSQGFIGREWVFEAIADWLGNPDAPRFFVLTGAPGAGKTAIAAQLCRLALGEVPSNLPPLPQNFLSAVHFFSIDEGWTNPLHSIDNLTRQLKAYFQAFTDAFYHTLKRFAEARMSITSTMNIGVNLGSEVAGVKLNIESLKLPLRDAMDWALREPLETMMAQNSMERVIILVDALDEARFSGEENSISSILLESGYIPNGIRFILTTRPDDNIFDKMKGESSNILQVNLSAGEGGATCPDSATYYEKSTGDIQHYIGDALRTRRHLIEALPPKMSQQTFSGIVQTKSENNFLYVHFLLKMIEEARSVILDQLPTGLNELYSNFLNRILRTIEDRQECIPVLGVLATAFEKLSERQLASFVRACPEDVRERVGKLRQFLTEFYSPTSRRLYTIYHRSFAEFLLDPAKADRWFCPAARQHKRIADYYLETPTAEWDDYGVHYASRHLAEATKEWPDQDNSLVARQRHELTRRWVELVESAEFQAYMSDNLLSLQRDLSIAVEAAANDKYATSPLLTVRSATASETFRENNMLPQCIFKLESSNLNAAQDRLALFDINPAWYQAILLELAWLTAKTDHKQAQALFEKVESQRLNKKVLDLLSKRVKRALNETPNHLQEEGGICELCMECPFILKALSQLRSLDRYDYYRHASLWRVLEWMLSCCRNDNTARDLTAHLAQSALAPNRPQFLETLHIITLALKARADRGARDELEKIKNAAMNQAPSQFAEEEYHRKKDEECWETLLDKCGKLRNEKEGRTLFELLVEIKTSIASSVKQAQGDTWAFNRRRLTTLAQAYDLIGKPDPDLVKLAMRSDLGGFPGWHMLALFHLAETIELIEPREQAQTHVKSVLERATKQALDTQDPRHCAINMARIRAMRSWFSGEHRMWRETVETFLRDPEGPDFAALHRIGDTYKYRVDLKAFRQATTLEELKIAYGWYPLSAFERLNPEFVNSPITLGREIKIPSPSFAPLMASRLSAGVVGDDGLTQDKKVKLIQRLVPLTINNPTALNIVLARLILVSDQSMDLLNEVSSIARKLVGQSYSDAA